MHKFIDGAVVETLKTNVSYTEQVIIGLADTEIQRDVLSHARGQHGP